MTTTLRCPECWQPVEPEPDGDGYRCPDCDALVEYADAEEAGEWYEERRDDERD